MGSLFHGSRHGRYDVLASSSLRRVYDDLVSLVDRKGSQEPVQSTVTFPRAPGRRIVCLERVATAAACVRLALDFLPRPATMTRRHHSGTGLFNGTGKACLATTIPLQRGICIETRTRISLKETHY